MGSTVYHSLPHAQLVTRHRLCFMKTLHLDPAQLRPLATGFGACYATDEIVVAGRNVGFMYREEPDGERDSGWRFTAGYEDQESTWTIPTISVSTISI